VALFRALKDTQVKMGIPMLLLISGLLVSHVTKAREVKIERPHWVIVVTVIDRRTGQKLKQSPITDPGLEFDDPAQCQTILSQVYPVQTDHFAAFLTCQKVGPEDVDL
jgi:hypothetical protein